MASTERAKKPRPAPSAALSRAQRREALRARRSRTMLVAAIVASALVIAAWFPATDLLHQHEQLAAASSELAHVEQQNRSLHRQAAQLENPSAVARIAEQQYDLVARGEKAYQVLPSSSSQGSSATGTLPASQTGAPGTGQASDRAKASPAPSKPPPTSGSFVSRVLQTLEFWR